MLFRYDTYMILLVNISSLIRDTARFKIFYIASMYFFFIIRIQIDIFVCFFNFKNIFFLEKTL